MRKCLISIAVAVCAIGQTRIDLRTQTTQPDFSAMPGTRPVQVGVALPPVCTTGELFFLTTAPVNQKLYGCTSANMWTLLSGSLFGSCTVDAASNVTCPGDLVTGNGSSAGEMRLYEPEAKGNGFVAWASPEDVTASYKLQLPAGSPAEGESLQFSAPVNGVAASHWAKLATKVLHSVYYPAAQSNGANGWIPGAGWSVRSDGTGPQIAGATDGPIDIGYLLFPDSATRTASLQAKLPENWAGGSVTVRFLWGAVGALTGQTLMLEVATACVADTQSIGWPRFNPAQRISVPVPFPGNATWQRATTVFPPIDVTGCSAGSLLLLQFSRSQPDNLTGGFRLLGAELSMWKAVE